MGNCFRLCKPRIGSCIGAVAAKHQKVVRVVKMDGKVCSPFLVKDILAASPAAMSSVAGKEQFGGIKRIKVVITKQQLQQLLTKQLSAEEVLSGLQKRASFAVDCATNWKPKLESIPEGSE